MVNNVWVCVGFQKQKQKVNNGIPIIFTMYYTYPIEKFNICTVRVLYESRRCLSTVKTYTYRILYYFLRNTYLQWLSKQNKMLFLVQYVVRNNVMSNMKI